MTHFEKYTESEEMIILVQVSALIIKIAVKEMNSIIRNIGLVPTRLFFGVIPTHPVITTELLRENAKIEIVAAAKTEQNAIIAERRIITALTKNPICSISMI